jgi:hypothetical protein
MSVAIYSAYAEGSLALNVASKVIQSVDIGASILNNSFGTTADVNYIRSAYAYAYKMNRISVCSKGNDGSNNYHYPADFGQGIISVGSAMPNGSHYNESNWGNGIDVIAPGVGIRSIIYNSETSTDQYTGTSFAAPHVAGLAALLLGYDNTLYNDDIENIINLSATDEYRPPAAEGYDDHTGYGIINARTAFDILQPPNCLIHFEEYGGYEHSATGYMMYQFFDVGNLSSGSPYLARRVEVRKWVNFDRPYIDIPNVWGTGVRAAGFSGANPNYGMGYTDIIPGTITETGCQARTFIYQVRTISMEYIGWYPCDINGVRFAYSVLGEEELLPADYIYCSLSDNDQAIQISIEDLNDYEQGWIIERKDATNQTWAVIDTIPNNPNEFVFYEDFYLVGSETYTYRAKPYSGNQINVAYSEEFTITARPNRPENVDAFTTDYGGIVPLGGMMFGFGLESIPELPDTLVEPLPHLYGNDITVIWSPPQNQKLPIVSYVVKRRPGVSPPNYVENVGLDTIFYKCPNNYNTGYTMEVYAIDSNGDTSLCASDGVQTGTTNTCPGTPTKESDYVADMVPLEFELQQNYPNPFNLNTTIAFSLPAESNVKLEIFDILGRKIKTLINENYIQGTHSIDWDGRDNTGRIVSSGVYFCRIESACGIKTRKMLLIK